MKNFHTKIPLIEEKINYVFRDKNLLRQAFIRTSYCNETREDVRSNETLEFFGDSALSIAIVTYLIKRRTTRYGGGIRASLTEGELTVIRSKLSDKKNLSSSVKSLGLEEFLIMGEGDIARGVGQQMSVMEDLFESIIGAIYIDSDFSVEAVMSAVFSMMDIEQYLTESAPTPMQSWKNQLQEWCAAKSRRLPPPRYETISESGPDHSKSFLCACYIGDEEMGRGEGKNLKLAQSAAAMAAMKRLKGEE